MTLEGKEGKSTERRPLGCRLLAWGYLLLTFAEAAMLGATGTVDWGSALALLSASWGILFVIVHTVDDCQPRRLPKRPKSQRGEPSRRVRKAGVSGSA